MEIKQCNPACTILFTIFTALIFLFSSTDTSAQDFTLFAEQTAGFGDAIVQIDVVNPAEATGDNYRVTFSETNSQIFFTVENLGTQEMKVNNVPLGTTSSEFEGITVTASASPPQIKEILEVQYGDTPVDPPVPVFRPGDRLGNGGNNSTNEYTFVGGAGDGSINFINRSEANAAPFDYEIRFDGDNLGRNKFIYRFLGGQGTINVPFSVWNVGIATPNDTTDDHQVIAVGFDDSQNLSVYNGGALPPDGGPGTMYDRIYVHEINQGALPQGDINNDGVVNYDDLLQDLEDNGGDISSIFFSRPYIGNEVLARLSMVSLNDDPNYLPPAGTTIRITTSKPLTDQDLYGFTSPDFGLFTTPFALNFGNVRLGEQFTLPLTLINSSDSEISIDAVTFELPDFQASQTIFSIAAGDSADIDIIFTPSSEGFIESTLSIASSDAFFPNYQISVSGEGLPIAEGAINILGRFDIKQNGIKRNDVTDIWGYVDSNTGIEYALVGYGLFTSPPDAGISIVDVMNPSRPIEAAHVNSVPGFDIKVWRNYLYSVTGGGGLGGILDLTDPTNPQVVGSFPSSHNIFISEDGFMYSTCPGLGVFDLNPDPTNPTLLWNDQIPSCHDAAAIGDRLFDFHGSAGTFIYDITEPSTPLPLLGSIIDPTIQLHHSGWTTEDGQYLFICDELATHPMPDLIVWDISDLDNPERVADFAEPNATIHNFYVIGNYAYVSYYHAGFWVFDVSDPTQPTVVDSFDTAPDFTGEGFNGAFGVYPFAPSGNIYVSDGQNGLYIFASIDPATSVDPKLSKVPQKFVLHQNYPNPFNPETTISYQLPKNTQVRIDIYNTLGQKIRTLIDSKQEQGSYRITWDGKNEAGLSVPSGIYFYRIKTDGFVDTRRMLLLK